MNLIAIGVAIIMACAALGISLGQSNALAKGLEGISRQPEAASKIQTVIIVGLAIMETIGVLSFVIAIMLIGKF